MPGMLRIGVLGWLTVHVFLLAASLPSGDDASQPDKAKPAKDFTNTVGMKLVSVAPGKFQMGSAEAEIARIRDESKNNWYVNEGPQHEVEISKSFYLSIHCITQAQYQKIMGTNPSWFSAKGEGKDEIKGQNTDDFPVETVSYGDAKEFCRKLGQKEGKAYRLPTEAEWEYACRAGTASQYYTGDGEKALKDIAWYEANSDSKPHPVGRLKANPWGLYDMCGNVCQWCEDWFDPEFYASSPRKDPTGPEIGECKVLRGGSWLLVRWGCRSATRLYGRHDNRDKDCGFRVVLVAQ